MKGVFHVRNFGQWEMESLVSHWEAWLYLESGRLLMRSLMTVSGGKNSKEYCWRDFDEISLM